MSKHDKTRKIQRTCPVCSGNFVTGSSIKIHCSPECRVREAAAQFSDPEACWEWDGSRNPQTGYGQLSSWENGKRRLYTAHRIAFRAFHGEIPDGLMVLHACDNPPCFNPAHLSVGSQKDNMDDMTSKGRDRKKPNLGSKHHAAKITEADAVAIRSSADTLETLSARYGLSFSALSAIRTGRNWTHV